MQHKQNKLNFDYPTCKQTTVISTRSFYRVTHHTPIRNTTIQYLSGMAQYINLTTGLIREDGA